MTPQEVIKIATIKDFYNVMNALNLTDRQKQIFIMKYSRGLRNIDIAEEITPPVCQDTISAELKIIREKLSKYALDKSDMLC